MQIKNKLAVEELFTATPNNQPLILLENTVNSDKELKKNLIHELESISFNSNALSENYFLKNVFKFSLFVITVIVTLLIIRSSDFGHGYLLFPLFLFGFFICLVSMKGVGADRPLSENDYKYIKKICEYNPKAAEHIRKKLLDNKPLIQRDMYYLKVPKQIEIIERHKKQQLMREMISQEQIIISPRIKEKLDTLKLDEHKTLKWYKEQYKRRVIKTLCLYAAWMTGLFLSITLDFSAIATNVLAAGGAIGFLIVIFVLVSTPAIQQMTEKLSLSEYALLLPLCKIDKRNRNYISKVLAEDRVLMRLDCDSMKFNEQLNILDAEKEKSMVAKQLGIEEINHV